MFDDTSKALYVEYERHLISECLAKIERVEQVIGDCYGFEINRSTYTTSALAKRWPSTTAGIPFSRVFGLVNDSKSDLIQVLQGCLARGIDVVAEIPAHRVESETISSLAKLGFRPSWEIPWLHVHVDKIMGSVPVGLTTRLLFPDEMSTFADIFVQGYGHPPETASAWHNYIQHGYSTESLYCFGVEVEGVLAAAGALHLSGDTALLDGATTLPQYRRRGAQGALLQARVRFAAEHGCRFAFSRTAMNSPSHRNMMAVGMAHLASSQAFRYGISP